MKGLAMTFLLYAVAAAALLAFMVLLAGQAGWLSGHAPADLGVRDGRLKAPSRTPNSVSSQADLHAGSGALVDYARIAPLAAGADIASAMARLRTVIERMPGARIVEARPDYLYAQFTTRWLKFVDDVEFSAAPAEGVIHVRSASRLGSSDLGVNRTRIEKIRAELSGAAAK
jgi:uncharacterized protein (DUF1499 family)